MHGAGAGRDAPTTIPYPIVFAYGLPRVGMGAVVVAIALYLAKFGTDVLLIPPAAMAVIHAVSRVWDGISDPLAGYLSDRTRTRFGRRRPWLAASVLPTFLFVWMLWSPPAGLDVWTLTLWVGLAYVLYETASTAFLIPHAALGVELTPDYHERTRLFGWTQLFFMFGLLLGLGFFHALNTADDPRALAPVLAVLAGGFWALTIGYAAWRLPERPEYSERPAPRLVKSFADVLRNRHARILLFTYGVDTLGAGAIVTLAPFVTQYVLGDASLATWLGLAFLLPQALLMPLWIALARRIDKKKLWMGAMAVMAAGFFGQFTFNENTPLWLALAITGTVGLARGVGEICAPAMQADIIDDDDLRTGERKEGAYLATWNLVRKGAGALAPFLTLSALQFTGYAPNEPQNEQTLFALRFFFGGFPCICFVIGIAIFARYELGQEQHAEIRRALDRREGGG